MRLNPEGLELLDSGCGEGWLAIPISELGFRYSGVDYSPHAISKSEERVKESAHEIRFAVGDVLRLDCPLLRLTYDVVLDYGCCHQFLADADQHRYLSNVRSLLRPDGLFLIFGAAVREDAYDGEIRSAAEFQEVFKEDLSKPREWQAWDGRAWVTVTLPCTTARPCRTSRHIREVEEAKFVVLGLHRDPNRKSPPVIDLVLWRPK